MKFGAEEIQETAAALGFRPDSLEKVFRLLSLLDALRSNAFLRPRVALKGETARNNFPLRCAPPVRGHRPQLPRLRRPRHDARGQTEGGAGDPSGLRARGTDRQAHAERASKGSCFPAFMFHTVLSTRVEPDCVGELLAPMPFEGRPLGGGCSVRCTAAEQGRHFALSKSLHQQRG